MRSFLVLLGVLLASATALAADPNNPCTERGTDLYLMNKCAEQRDAARKRDAERERDRNPSGAPQAPTPGKALLLTLPPTPEESRRAVSTLRSSVIHGDPKGALTVIDRVGPGPLPGLDRGMTLLMIAAWRGYGELAARLAALGPAAATDVHGNDARLYAAAGGGWDVIRMLRGKGVECNDEGWSPVALAASRRDSAMVGSLIVAGYAADGCGQTGVPPLVAATAAGDSESVLVLLKYGASRDLAGRLGKTAQQLLENPAAVQQVAQAAAAAIDRMRAEIDRAVAGYSGRPEPAGARPAASFVVPALSAAQRELVVKALTASQAAKTVLDAARSGDVGGVRSALAQGADPFSTNTSGESPVLVAARHGQIEVLKLLFAQTGGFNVTQVMEEAGAAGHVDALRLIATHPRFRMGTGTFQAVLFNLLTRGTLTPEVALFLLDNGAKSAGLLPTVLAQADNPTLLQALIGRGLDVRGRVQGFAKRPHYRDSEEDDQTSLMFVSQAGNRPGMAGALIDAGVDVNARTKLGRSALWYAATAADEQTVRVLIQAKADVNAHDNEGRTPLAQAITARFAGKGTDELVKRLIEAGADVNARDSNGVAPLMQAAAYGGVKTVNVLKLLIDAGANVNAPDKDGNTPLHYATRGNYATAQKVQMLIDAGANVLAKNRHGQWISSFDLETSVIINRAHDLQSGIGKTPAPAPAPAPAPLASVQVSAKAPTPPPAQGQWLHLGRAGNGDTISVDKASISREGATVRIWTLIELAQPQRMSDGTTYRSQKTQFELDCASNRARILQVHSYAESAGDGGPVASEWDARRWRIVGSDLTAVAMMKEAC